MDMIGKTEEALSVLTQSASQKQASATLSTMTDLETLIYIADCYSHLGDSNNERKYLLEALKIAENNFPENHKYLFVLNSRLASTETIKNAIKCNKMVENAIKRFCSL